jgi:hypothetical protein
MHFVPNDLSKPDSALPSGFVAVPQPYRNGNVITIRRRYGGAVD